MALRKILPSQEYLKECLDYDPTTGILTWKERPSSHFGSATWHSRWSKKYPVGAIAGVSEMYGHLIVALNQENYQAHRLIWKLVTGCEEEEIDHRDRNGSNNRWLNLRPATHSQNMANGSRSKANTSGAKGVSWDGRRGKYRAYIVKDKKQIWLGYFPDITSAQAAYCQASIRIFGEFWCSG